MGSFAAASARADGNGPRSMPGAGNGWTLLSKPLGDLRRDPRVVAAAPMKFWSSLVENSGASAGGGLAAPAVPRGGDPCRSPARPVHGGFAWLGHWTAVRNRGPTLRRLGGRPG